MPKKTFDLTINREFRFCGEGAGVPGLPHVVTSKQAEELGLLEVLDAAVRNGNYKPVMVEAAAPAKEKESE